MIDKVEGLRIGSDINHYVIALFKHVQKFLNLPEEISKDEYKDIMTNRENHPAWLVGYVGICCSYSGKWFGGYAGKTKTRQGLRDYQAEAKRNLLAQIDGLQEIDFRSQEYFDLKIPSNSIIYCDPPYEGTTKYFTSFNHSFFWDWCRQQKANGHTVFLSEYNAPDDFKCVLEFPAKSSLSANGLIGGNKPYQRAYQRG